MFLVVPNYIAEEIDSRLNAEIAKHPDAEKDRDVLREQLLAYVSEHGEVPDFSLSKNA